MKTTINIFRTLLLAVLTLTFGSCSEDSLLSELGLDGQTTTRTDEVGGVWNGSIATAFAGGSGTAEDPYQIADGAQLARFAAMVNGTLDGTQQNTAACGKLTADILLNDISNWTSWNESTAPANTWTPIGNSSQPFTGTLDGDGHSVSGIYINSTADDQGLVGYLGSGGTLQNLGVKASYIKGGYYAGGVCGWNSSGTVTNCYNTGSVEGNYIVGGLCGDNEGTVTNCYNTGSVSGNYSVGGLCGWNNATVTNCYNNGSVTGSDFVGGLCGRNNATVTNCYNTGSVEGNYSVGGLCGMNEFGTVTNCYNAGNVAGNSSVGGVCGYNNFGTVTNCYYLTGTTAGGIGEDYNSGEATEKTAEQFQSGEVAWLLQNEQEGQVWGQTIGTDEYPVLGGEKVLQIGNGYVNELKQDGDFYLISTANELRLFASMVNSGQTSIRAKLTADIELNNTTGWENWNESTEGLNSWTPIGSGSQPFTGTLDGDGHSVSGIYINSTADYQGLVGYLGGGTLQNLGVKASYIKGGNRVGGLCGWKEGGSVTNCYNIGSVESTGAEAGGVCGTSTSGNVSNCYNTGSVTGYKWVGGVCGGNSGTVTNCYNTGSVEGNEIVGGVCGRNSSTVTNCYNSGSVEGNYSVGGVCGLNYGIMTNCYNSGSVEDNYNVGGVCGNSFGTVTNCYYLNTCGAAGVGTSKTADEFASGEVAWLLQNGQTEQVWGQAIGTDDYPVLDADGTKRVYAVTLYQGSDAADARYLNSNGTFPTLTDNAIALVDAGSPFSGKNIVVKDGDNNYTCDNLVLTDDADFYTPVEFTATNATYTRSPKVWAKNDGSGSGWETICLPFSGTLYADDVAKQPVLTDLAGDYWLRSLTDFKTPNTLIFASGSTATAADHQIKAGVPYIIALPGNTFGGESLEGQTISVRGTGVTVLTTAARIQPEGSLFAFTGTFATKACDAASYRLNSENGSKGAGNLFVLDTNKLAPFRCRIDVKGLIIGGASTRSASGLPKELRIGQ